MKKWIFILLATLFIVGCGRKFEPLEDGQWHQVTYNGRTHFVKTGADSVIIYSDTIPTTYSYKVQGRRIILKSDKARLRIKTRQITATPYVEPDFTTSDYQRFCEPYLQVSTTKDLVYGHAKGYWSSLQGAEADVKKVFTQGYVKSFKQKDLDLTLDLYRPVGVREKRPLILFIHGGAFYVGDKQEPAYIDLCRHFASMGYVTASMNYRMGFHVGKSDIERAGYVAAQDAHAAMRWLVSKSDEFGIDPNWLYVAGSSAGSITALNMVFMKEKERPESTRGEKHLIGADDEDLGPIDKADNNLRNQFHVRGIANMWGAVSTLSLLKNSQTAIISFHGDADEVVPFDVDYPFSMAGKLIAKGLSDPMYGSKAIHKEAVRIGLRSEFHPYAGQGHAFNTSGKDKKPNANHYAIRADITRFFYEDLIGEKAAIEPLGDGRYQVTGAFTGDISWKVTGGFIISADGAKIQVLWRAGEPHELQASGTYESGAGFLLTLD